jgi:5,5'-dehydrodivanillate O-demethylase oxygenase subunit
MQRGDDPKGVIRDPDANDCIEWPFAPWRARMERDFTLAEYLEQRARFRRGAADDFFSFYAGQPEAVRQQFKAAMGIGAEHTDSLKAAAMATR